MKIKDIISYASIPFVFLMGGIIVVIIYFDNIFRIEWMRIASTVLIMMIIAGLVLYLIIEDGYND